MKNNNFVTRRTEEIPSNWYELTIRKNWKIEAWQTIPSGESLRISNPFWTREEKPFLMIFDKKRRTVSVEFDCY